ncbi:MAG: response regulator [Synergistaceae bacterium]|nr:response regulator [Synergistaceae bacterium]
MENKKLAREFKYQQSINERNRISAETKDNLSKIVSAEKSRLEKYMNLLLANCLDAIMLFDREGHIVFTSDSYLRSTGTSAFGMIRGKSYRELLTSLVEEGLLQRIDEIFQASLGAKRFTEIECDIDFGGLGNVRHYLAQVTSMLEEDGTTEGVMLFFYDTTEISQARRDAERARELAEQSTRAKSEFLSRMSHEIRTPMNAIIGMTSIAKASNQAERKEYCLDKISEASTHLLGVINDILDMSKIEANKFDLSIEEFNFRKMIERVTNVIRFRVEEKGQSLSVDVSDNIPVNIVSDEQRLAQVITNLLGNAVKFTPEHGSVALLARKIAEEEEVCSLYVEIKDTGIGISEEQQQRLFTSFEQADGSISRKFGGTGLGLAISKRIVEMMSGRIWIESELGKGASFIFEIKAKRGAEMKIDGDDFQGEENYDMDVDNDDIFCGKRVLIAEDVIINREIVQALIGHTGIEIDFAFDGMEAVEKFIARPGNYELILMDVQMPRMDGYEATKRIRDSGLPEADLIPIIAMTANVFREDIERCRVAGMNDHLGKPIDAEEVIAKLRHYL